MCPAFQKLSDLQMIAWQILGQNTWSYIGKKVKDTQEFSQADRFKYFQYTGLQLMSKQNLVSWNKKDFPPLVKTAL